MLLVRRLTSAFLGPLLLAACNLEPPTAVGPTGVMSDYVTSVSAQGGTVVGVLRGGALPSGVKGPVSSVAGISGAVNGGSAKVTLAGNDGFQRVLVGVQGVDGWFELMLPSGVLLEDLVVGIAPGLTGGALQMRYVLDGAQGLGPMVTQQMRVIKVGTGDVQVNVAWTGASDIDLHVFDPTGEEVFYDHKVSRSGGLLDLDSNAACTIDGRNAENVVWPASTAPHGTYRVVIDYYDDCGVERTDWIVTVQAAGAAPRTYAGTFTGLGASTPMLQVATFDF